MASPGLICVITRPPLAGAGKTRLAADVGAPRAAKLAQAFLADTWALVTGVTWARCVLALSHGAPADLGLRGPLEVWPQGEGDLGERLERVLRRGLSAAEFVLVLASDSPGLPVGHLEQARRALSEVDAVLGPADDGGFYLIGLRRCPEGLLTALPWSTPATCSATRARFAERGLTSRTLAPWFDVDVAADLEQLRTALARGEAHAPATAALLLAQSVSVPAGSVAPALRGPGPAHT